MSKKYIVILGVAILFIAAAAVGYTQFGKQKTSPPPAPSQEKKTTQNAQTEEKDVKGTLVNLLQAGKTVKCTFTYAPKDGGGSGTIYVSGKKMSGNFKTTVEGKVTEANVVYDGEYSYIWTADSTSGIKMKIDPQEQASAAADNKNFDWSKEMEYTCTPWVADESKFTAPTTVKFSDFSSLMPKPSGSKTNVQQNAQSICDQIPDAAAKEQCIKSLSN